MVRDNRVTVTLPERLLDFLNSEVKRQGMDPRKKGTILANLLSKEYDRVNAVGERPQDKGAVDIEALSDAVVKRALQKIEIRLTKK